MDKPTDSELVVVGAKVPKFVKDALLRVCRSDRRSLSQLIRFILLDWYEQQKGPTDDRPDR